MRTRVAIAFVSGLVIGLAAAYVHSYFKLKPAARPSALSSQELLKERVRCKGLADTFVKSRSNADTTMFLEMVDYSPSRASCIAAVHSATSAGKVAIDVMDYEVIDVLTNESLYWDSCRYSKGDCGGGKDMAFVKERDRIFALFRAAPESTDSAQGQQ